MIKAQNVTRNTSCPVCCKGVLTESLVEDTFEIEGAKQCAVAIVPQLECDTCGFSFTDERAEAPRHDAACIALGVLGPDEIRAVRDLYGMNRRAFATAFHIGHASLERWENRKLIIGLQSDFYLRALQDVSVGERLLKQDPSSRAIDLAQDGNVIHVDFPALKASKGAYAGAIDRERRFSLAGVRR